MLDETAYRDENEDDDDDERRRRLITGVLVSFVQAVIDINAANERLTRQRTGFLAMFGKNFLNILKNLL